MNDRKILESKSRTKETFPILIKNFVNKLGSQRIFDGRC